MLTSDVALQLINGVGDVWLVGWLVGYTYAHPESVHMSCGHFSVGFGLWFGSFRLCPLSPVWASLKIEHTGASFHIFVSHCWRAAIVPQNVRIFIFHSRMVVSVDT